MPTSEMLIVPPSMAGPEGALRRELLEVVRQVRRASPEIAVRGLASESQREAVLGQVRALLRSGLSARRVTALVATAGEAGERLASRPWAPVSAAAEAREARGDRSRQAAARRRLRAPGGKFRKPYESERVLRGWVRETSALVSSVRDDMVRYLEADLVAAVQAGTSAETLAARWVAEGIPVRYGTAEGRFSVIARTELAKLNRRVQEARAESVGAAVWMWDHRPANARDFRPEHTALHGRRFKWGDPPGGVYPGDLPNCQCAAITVLDGDLLEDLGVRSPRRARSR